MKTTKYERHNAVMHWFESPKEFAKHCLAMPPGWQKCDEHWTGETWAQAIEGAIRGRRDHIKEAERMLAKFTAELEVPKTTWVRSMAGAYPCVPDVVMGHPDSMRRKIQAVDPITPLRIFCDTTSSGGVDYRELLQRGITIMALAMVLESVRPVEFYVTCTNSRAGHGASNLITRLSSSPMDLSVVCNALTSQGYTRGMGYRYGEYHDHATMAWEWDFTPHEPKLRAKWIARWRRCLGADRRDLIIPPLYLRDPMVKDPIGFLHRTVAEYTNPEAQEAMLLNLDDDIDLKEERV